MHSKVKTIKYSGNISSSKDVKSLEIKIEKAFPNKLGFTSTTIIRSCDEIRSLIDRNPFKGIDDTPESRLNVTFLKNESEIKMKFPVRPEKKSYKLWQSMIVLCSA